MSFTVCKKFKNVFIQDNLSIQIIYSGARYTFSISKDDFDKVNIKEHTFITSSEVVVIGLTVVDNGKGNVNILLNYKSLYNEDTQTCWEMYSKTEIKLLK